MSDAIFEVVRHFQHNGYTHPWTCKESGHPVLDIRGTENGFELFCEACDYTQVFTPKMLFQARVGAELAKRMQQWVNEQNS